MPTDHRKPYAPPMVIPVQVIIDPILDSVLRNEDERTGVRVSLALQWLGEYRRRERKVLEEHGRPQ